MRVMTREEIDRLVQGCEWAVICAVTREGKPYAIEATPFFLGQDVCFMINPRGGVYRCVAANPNVLVKFTWASPGLGHWAGASCLGRGRFDPDPGARLAGWRELGRIMNEDYSCAARFLSKPTRSPLFRVRVESMTGRCSAKPGEPLVLDTPGQHVHATEE